MDLFYSKIHLLYFTSISMIICGVYKILFLPSLLEITSFLSWENSYLVDILLFHVPSIEELVCFMLAYRVSGTFPFLMLRKVIYEWNFKKQVGYSTWHTIFCKNWKGKNKKEWELLQIKRDIKTSQLHVIMGRHCLKSGDPQFIGDWYWPSTVWPHCWFSL